MAVRHPCYRHSVRGVWIAGCPDCTAWHRAALSTRHVASHEQPSRADEPVGAGDRP